MKAGPGLDASATAPPEALGFLLLPRYSLLALAGACETLAAANLVLGRAAYTPVLLSADGRPASAGCGTRLNVDRALADAPPLAGLFVVSGLPLPDAGRDGHRATLPRRCARRLPRAPCWAASAPAAPCWPRPGCWTATAPPCTTRWCSSWRRRTRRW